MILAPAILEFAHTRLNPFSGEPCSGNPVEFVCRTRYAYLIGLAIPLLRKSCLEQPGDIVAVGTIY
jgi:hypothetical protein